MYTQTEPFLVETHQELTVPSFLSDLFKRSSTRHDHLCPRQVLGVRMGLAGLAAIGLEAPMPHKAALVIVETDGCFADGIEVATGITVGHRTLRVKDFGKIAAVFANVQTGQAVRLAPQLDIRERARLYAPEIKKKYYAQLKGYQLMPEAELFSFEKVLLEPSLAAIISRPGLHRRCDRCGEEIINARQVMVREETLCAACAGTSYYY
ncbi:MAG: FmdE family protein [Chloroflexi bacterium]|nr:FmdE family protein [Chloroflexota bacterium]